MDFVTAVGALAALLTTLANVPQAIKCRRTRSAGDISWKAYSTLALGLMMWVV